MATKRRCVLMKFGPALSSAMLAIEASDFAGGFAIGGPFFQIGTFITRHFSLRNGDLGFQFAVFPMQIKKNKGTSAHLGFAIKLIDFGAVEQKFAHSVR